MEDYLLKNLSELAHRRAILMREEAQLWDILSRDLNREAGRRAEQLRRRTTPAPVPSEPPKTGNGSERLLVPIPEAARMMGIGRSSLYREINASRIKVRKAGKRTLIAVSDIREWCSGLPESGSTDPKQ